MRRESRSPIVARMIATVIFGCSFIFSKEVLTYITPVQLLAYRFLLAASLLYLLKCFKVISISVNFKQLNELKPLLLISFFQPIAGYFFEVQGINRLTAAESGITLALIPIIVTIVGAVLLKENPNRRQVMFIVLSFIGVLLILIIKDVSFKNVSISGSIFLLISAFCSGIYIVLSRKVSVQFSHLDITFVMMLSGAVFFNALNLVSCIIKDSVGSYVILFQNKYIWAPIVYLGIFSSVIGFLFTNYSLSKITALRVAVFNNFATVIAIVAAVLIRKETFSFLQMVGAAMIVIGVWGCNYFVKAKA